VDWSWSPLTNNDGANMEYLEKTSRNDVEILMAMASTTPKAISIWMGTRTSDSFVTSGSVFLGLKVRNFGQTKQIQEGKCSRLMPGPLNQAQFFDQCFPTHHAPTNSDQQSRSSGQIRRSASSWILVCRWHASQG